MRRFVAAIINIISAIVAIVALSMLQYKYPDNNYSNVTRVSSFEKTDEFIDIINEKIDDIFLYVQLKNCFETNNKLNNDITIAESIDKDGNLKKWTIKECREEAIKHGLYIDTDFTVGVLSDQTTIPFSKSNTYDFIFKAYPSTIRTGTTSEEDFMTEFMYCLARYYKYQFTLGSENSNFKYRLFFLNKLNDETLEYLNTDMSTKEILDANAFIYLSSEDNITSSNIYSVNSSTLKRAKENNPIMDSEFNMYCFVDTNYTEKDVFREAYDKYINSKKEFAILTTIIIYSLLTFTISLIIAIMFLLATKKHVDESKELLYIVPTEFYIIIYILLITISFFLINRFINSERFSHHNMSTIKVNAYLLSLYVTTILLFTIFASKFENDTLTPLSLKALKENSEYGDNNLTVKLLFIVIFVPIVIFILLSIYMFYLFSMTSDIRILVSGIILLISTFGFVVYILLLHNSFDKAIQVQVKSNEMRTSLIANVSHDIKTPLTSILNYTDLITEEISNYTRSSKKNLEKYSEIIINKSHRLNDLINDLIFDSKVSSGNVELNMVAIDLNAFLSQVIAEFTDKFNERNLKIVYNNSASNVNILADSSQLYRVFQNLFSNIYKYALENSRVYVDLESVKSKTIITIKNIQKEKLEVSADTLKDRFVRGNKSRSTEGFGLGLSISENLVNSMNGKLDIISVRDLFTTKLTFVSYEA